jgi:hypothetical protein
VHAAEDGVEGSTGEFGDLAERKIGLEAQDEHFALRVREIGDGQFEEGEIIAVRRGLASRSEGCGEFVQNGCALVPLVATEKRDRHIVGDAIEPTAELGFLPVVRQGSQGSIVCFLQGILGVVVAR